VPSAFVLLAALPLTPNGKIDRRALPAPKGRLEQEQAFVAPRTSVEEALAGIWSEVLRLKQIGIDDNFFELGGHSLLATQVMSRIHNTFRITLPLRTLFENPTVEKLAVVITQNQAEEAGRENLGQILTELEALSDEDAQRLLTNQTS